MSVLQKVGAMIRHTEQTQAQVAQRLAQQKAQQAGLQQAIDGLSLQWQEIEKLLQGQKLANRVIDRADLFMLQQRQAVLRQQQYQLHFERDRLREETEALEKMQQETRAEMLLLKRKQQKFEHWSSLQKRQRMLQRLQRDETESEERIMACGLR
ncbi:MAG TPA: hypothetical protein VGN04_00790 [Herbaspirillum sp.]|jgi:hypothetical protein